MKRRILQYSLLACLLLSTGFAGWAWFRPYAWKIDPAARCSVVETLLTRDQSFFWVNVHLKMLPGMTHDLQKPVKLETNSGKFMEPADSTFAGKEGGDPDEMWFKFWLEAEDLSGPLILHLNGGSLSVKAGEGLPVLGNSTYKNFTTHRW